MIEKEIAHQLFDPQAKRRMSVKSQIAFIKRQLKTRGIEPDLVDVEALVDPTLSYRENLKNVMTAIGPGAGKIKAGAKEVIEDPACEKARELKAEARDAKTQCDCAKCEQMGLYDPDPDPRAVSKRPPRRWFSAMLRGIRRRSDVVDPAAVVANIWYRLSGKKRAEIKLREKRGEKFAYDLPLPEDHPAKGGLVRIVRPFKLAEVQVNVAPRTFAKLLRSRMFSRMKRSDGSMALVKRCKSDRGNANIFVDRIMR